jgi:hypothetical protein
MYSSNDWTVRVSLTLLACSVKMTVYQACRIRLSEDEQQKCWFFEQ